MSTWTLRLRSYTAVAFSGWYTGAEVSHNLADFDRCDALYIVARALSLNVSSDRTLWKDRALLELNLAVLHSFTQVRITIVDHYTLARQFLRFEERERKPADEGAGLCLRRVPAISPSTLPVFYRQYRVSRPSPRLVAQTPPWEWRLLASSGRLRPHRYTGSHE